MDGWIVLRKRIHCQKPYLEFPPGIEFLQALHRFLPVHHGGDCGPLLQEENGLGGNGNNGSQE